MTTYTINFTTQLPNSSVKTRTNHVQAASKAEAIEKLKQTERTLASLALGKKVDLKIKILSVI